MKIPDPSLGLPVLGDSLPAASQPSNTQTKSATSSLRNSLRASQQDSLRLHRSSLGIDLLKDQLTKVRPPLTPTLFTQNGEESGEGPFSKPLKHTALMEKLQQIYNEAETAENGGGTSVQSSDHMEVLTQGSEDNEKEVIQQRLKFKKKLMSSPKPGKNAKAKTTCSDANQGRRKTVVPPQPSPLAVSLSAANTNQKSTLTSVEHRAPQQQNVAPLLPQNHTHFPTENKNVPGIFSDIACSFKISIHASMKY